MDVALDQAIDLEQLVDRRVRGETDDHAAAPRSAPTYDNAYDGWVPRIELVEGDITHEHVDAIVNAANSTLLGGGGVDGAIHRRGGRTILEACRDLRRDRYPTGLPIGEAVATTAGELPARWVIHTVGPIYGVNAIRRSSSLDATWRVSGSPTSSGAATVAFPAISTGVYGYPVREAAAVAIDAVRDADSRSRRSGSCSSVARRIALSTSTGDRLNEGRW